MDEFMTRKTHYVHIFLPYKFHLLTKDSDGNGPHQAARLTSSPNVKTWSYNIMTTNTTGRGTSSWAFGSQSRPTRTSDILWVSKNKNPVRIWLLEKYRCLLTVSLICWEVNSSSTTCFILSKCVCISMSSLGSKNDNHSPQQGAWPGLGINTVSVSEEFRSSGRLELRLWWKQDSDQIMTCQLDQLNYTRRIEHLGSWRQPHETDFGVKPGLSLWHQWGALICYYPCGSHRECQMWWTVMGEPEIPGPCFFHGILSDWSRKFDPLKPREQPRWPQFVCSTFWSYEVTGFASGWVTTWGAVPTHH